MKAKIVVFTCLCLTALGLWFCAPETESEDTTTLTETPYAFVVPAGFPEPEIPEDNPLTKERVELGRRLFFDPALSVDSSISCSSCHLAAYAMGDNQAVSFGVQGRAGIRNTPPLFNGAWRNSFMRDGGVPTLEMQVLAPVAEHAEMDFTMRDVYERLNTIPFYVDAAKRIYDREPDPYVITRSLAAYQRVMVSGNSPYDQYLSGNEDAMSSSARRGLELFTSDSLSCTTCHNGFNFTNNELENNGLYLNYADSGRARITMRNADNGLFLVPSLRNIGVSGPYMHDGSLETLHDVIDHYESGGADHPLKHPALGSFQLDAQSEKDLIAFLESLTDTTFLQDPILQNPWFE